MYLNKFNCYLKQPNLKLFHFKKFHVSRHERLQIKSFKNNKKNNGEK